MDEAVGVYEGLGILTDHGLRGTIERYVQAGALSDLKFQTRGTVGFKSLPSINFPPAEVFLRAPDILAYRKVTMHQRHSTIIFSPTIRIIRLLLSPCGHE